MFSSCALALVGMLCMVLSVSTFLGFLVDHQVAFNTKLCLVKSGCRHVFDIDLHCNTVV
jgi:hypothetical protein